MVEGQCYKQVTMKWSSHAQRTIFLNMTGFPNLLCRMLFQEPILYIGTFWMCVPTIGYLIIVLDLLI